MSANFALAGNAGDFFRCGWEKAAAHAGCFSVKPSPNSLWALPSQKHKHVTDCIYTWLRAAHNTCWVLLHLALTCFFFLMQIWQPYTFHTAVNGAWRSAENSRNRVDKFSFCWLWAWLYVYMYTAFQFGMCLCIFGRSGAVCICESKHSP